MASKFTRRLFMITGGLAGGALVLGVGGNMYLNKKIKEYSKDGLGQGVSMNAWITITPDNKVKVAVPRAEMGQGVYTSIPMLIAEELEVSMDQIEVMHPQPESPFANTFFLAQKPRDIYEGLSFMEKVAMFMPVIGTGGSTTIVDSYDNLRAVGASARHMLLEAAAKEWNVDKSELRAENGHIIGGGGKKATYGSLAGLAAGIEITEIPELKKQKDFKIIGTPVKRIDIPSKTNGSAQFGLDVRLDGMRFGAIRHATVIGGTIEAVNNQAEIEDMKGVDKVVLLKDGSAVVVVGDNTWRAKNASLALDLKENDNGNGNLSSATVMGEMAEIINSGQTATPFEHGSIEGKFEGEGVKIVEATYDVPYLAHACMEVMNCTALINDNDATVWLGHQAPSVVLDKVAETSGVDKGSITVNITYLGGGFGRRAEIDMVVKATEVAMAMKGTPVQLFYSREENMRNDMYRPCVGASFRVAMNEKGDIDAWENKIAIQSVGYSSMMRILPAMAEPPEKDPSTIEGAAHLPYEMGGTKVTSGEMNLPVMVGNWRSVGSSQNAFFTESMIDEVAHAAGQDPYLFRKAKLSKSPRFAAVLDKVAAMANWNTPLPEGKFRGIALAKSFGSIVAQVAEISQIGDKEFSLDKYYIAIDCGRIVNPDTVKAQMESGVIYALTAALYGEISVKNGRVVEGNFPQYPMLSLKQTPKMDVHIMEVDEYPGGVGEPSTPPAAPALTNAIFAATGTRIRKLPLKKQGYKFV